MWAEGGGRGRKGARNLESLVADKELAVLSCEDVVRDNTWQHTPVNSTSRIPHTTGGQKMRDGKAGRRRGSQVAWVCGAAFGIHPC